jgi:flagellin
MQVTTNVNALIANTALNNANFDAQKAVQRISSGLRISNSADDPAAIGPANRLKADIASRVKVSENINAGIGVLQIMDSAMSEISNILQSMRTLAVSSASGSTSSNDRTAMASAFSDYNTAIDTIAASATYNGTALLGATATTVVIQSGIGATDTTTISSSDATKAATGLATTALTIATTAGAATAITGIDTAIGTLSGKRAVVGSQMNLLTSLATINDNFSTANTRTLDKLVSTDYATEIANLSSAQIRQNASAAMMAQSHSMTRDVVSFLLKST